jgi:hypothetical protein
MQRRLSLIALLAVLVASGASLRGCKECCHAQLQVRPFGRTASHEVRITNELGTWVQFRVIGQQEQASLYHALADGGTVNANLYAGDRVVAAWDRAGALVLVAKVLVDRAGDLTLRGPYAPTRARPPVIGEAAPPPASLPPTLEIHKPDELRID